MLNINFSGQKKLIKRNASTIKNLQNKRGTFLKAVIVYESWVKRNFNANGKLHENSGLHWRPLQEKTLKARRGGGGQILRDTGALYVRWFRSATNRFGELKSAVKYSSVHERGSSRKNIPRRKIFPTDKQGSKIVHPVFSKFVKKAVEK